MEGLDKIGFDCGWDHAEYGVIIPDHLMVGTLADGLHAGLAQRGRSRPKEADRYVRKWLQLRRNAWRRERIFDDAVTPEYIRRIDKTLEDIYRYPLYQSATDTLNRQLKAGINDADLIDLVFNLREDGRLCLVDEQDQQREPRLICSLGLA